MKKTVEPFVEVLMPPKPKVKWYIRFLRFIGVKKW